MDSCFGANILKKLCYLKMFELTAKTMAVKNLVTERMVNRTVDLNTITVIIRICIAKFYSFSPKPIIRDILRKNEAFLTTYLYTFKHDRKKLNKLKLVS